MVHLIWRLMCGGTKSGVQKGLRSTKNIRMIITFMWPLGDQGSGIILCIQKLLNDRTTWNAIRYSLVISYIWNRTNSFSLEQSDTRRYFNDSILIMVITIMSHHNMMFVSFFVIIVRKRSTLHWKQVKIKCMMWSQSCKSLFFFASHW